MLLTPLTSGLGFCKRVSLFCEGAIPCLSVSKEENFLSTCFTRVTVCIREGEIPDEIWLYFPKETQSKNAVRQIDINILLHKGEGSTLEYRAKGTIYES